MNANLKKFIQKVQLEDDREQGEKEAQAQLNKIVKFIKMIFKN